MPVRPLHRRILPLLAGVALAAPLLAGTGASAASAVGASRPSADVVAVTASTRGLIQPLPSHLAVGLPVAEPLARGAAGARVVGGALPPGVALDSRAVLSGTPTTSGSFSAQVELRVPGATPGRPVPQTFTLALTVDTSRETVAAGDIAWDEAADTFRFAPSVVDASGEAAASAVGVRVVSGPGRIAGTLTFDRVKPGSDVVVAARGSGTTVVEVATTASAPVRVVLRRGMGADLSVKIAGPRRVSAVSTAVYTFSASNAGPLAANGLVAAVEIPEGAAFVASTCGGTPIGTRLLITADGLGVGQTLGCEVTIGIPPAPRGTVGVVRVGITSLAHDPHTDNNVRATTVRIG